MSELAQGRDFSSYGAQMDASLASKLEDLWPWFIEGTVVDKGCGTGRLLQAIAHRFPATHLVGVDLSEEFLRQCAVLHRGADWIQADVAQAQLPPNSASMVLFSSVVHEIYTYSAYNRDRVRHALRSAASELRPGGRVWIRDGVSPGPGTWRMELLEPGLESIFERFASEFKHGEGAAWRRLSDGQIELSAHLANEFLCKKDYLRNWHIEVHEEFGTFSALEWPSVLAEAGLKPLAVQARHNPWILQNRYDGKVRLTSINGEHIPWPATNVVVVGEKQSTS